jgi:hypothetical protein
VNTGLDYLTFYNFRILFIRDYVIGDLFVALLRACLAILNFSKVSIVWF